MARVVSTRISSVRVYSAVIWGGVFLFCRGSRFQTLGEFSGICQTQFLGCRVDLGWIWFHGGRVEFLYLNVYCYYAIFYGNKYVLPLNFQLFVAPVCHLYSPWEYKLIEGVVFRVEVGLPPLGCRRYFHSPRAVFGIPFVVVITPGGG